MTVWIIFIWISVSSPPMTMGSFESKVECEDQAAVYKRAKCISVVVPKP